MMRTLALAAVLLLTQGFFCDADLFDPVGPLTYDSVTVAVSPTEQGTWGDLTDSLAVGDTVRLCAYGWRQSRPTAKGPSGQCPNPPEGPLPTVEVSLTISDTTVLKWVDPVATSDVALRWAALIERPGYARQFTAAMAPPPYRLVN